VRTAAATVAAGIDEGGDGDADAIISIPKRARRQEERRWDR